MTGLDQTLDWGGKLTFFVGDVAVGGTVTGAVTCIEEPSQSGTTFSLIDIAAGTNKGTYYGKAAVSSCDDSHALVGSMSSHW
jgi:hypothetical protein